LGREGVTLLTPVREYANNGKKGFQQSLYPDFTPLRSPEISRVPGFKELERYIIFFLTPGRSAPAITSSSCSRTSTRNPLHRAGSIRSVTPPAGSSLPPEDASGNIFSGSALMFSISLHIESNGYLLHAIYIPPFQIYPSIQ
jgi:hypothetical protein